MNDTTSIFGCFVSATQPYPDASQETKDLALGQGRLFRIYIWRERGLCDTLKKIRHEDYGKDLKLALFRFYVNPLPIEIQYLKTIEDYRKRERAIGIPIIITNKNFFSKSEEERHNFLKQSILQKLDLLGGVVKKKKLDTNMVLLKDDVQRILKNYP